MAPVMCLGVFQFEGGRADAWGWERPQPQQWECPRGGLLAAPSPPDTEVYLEKWSPQSALGQLQAKLDASEAESEVSQERPWCYCPFLAWAMDCSLCPPVYQALEKRPQGCSAIWAPSVVPWLLA